MEHGKTRGKRIVFHLVDGTVEGLITARLTNWNVKGFKIPRNKVRKCEQDVMKDAGVYFLICQDDDGTDSVYIGEAANVLNRLKQHLKDNNSNIFYWHTAIGVVGDDLTKDWTRYLENRFVEIVNECGRYRIRTQKTHKNTVVTEDEIDCMEEFIDTSKILIEVLGYKNLVSVPKTTDSTVYLNCKGKGASAKGYVSATGFTVLKGSTVCDPPAPSFKEKKTKCYYEQKMHLQENGIIKNQEFTRDEEFSSPTAAAAIILGRSANGRIEWKTADGVKLKDLEL